MSICAIISLSFLGDRARYPFKLRGRPLVTTSIVVAVKNTDVLCQCFFRAVPMR